MPEGKGRADNEYGISPWFSRILTGLCYVATVVVGLVLWWKFASGIYGKLDWGTGFFGAVAWVIAGVGSAIVSYLICLAIFMLLSIGIELIAVITGGAIAFALSGHFGAVVLANDLHPYWLQGMQALVSLLWIAYVFPILHLIISVGGRGLGESITRIVDSVYSDTDRSYFAFIRDLATIGLTGVLVSYAIAADMYWSSSVVATVSICIVMVLVVFVLVGDLVRLINNRILGALISGLLGYLIYSTPRTGELLGGPVGAALAAVVAFALCLFLVFPVVYCLVKLIVRPLLASWLAKPLARLRETLCEEIFGSVYKTYQDSTDYGKFFAHVFGIGVSVLIYIGLTNLVSMLGFSSATLQMVPAVATVTVYLIAGKLFVRYDNLLIGVLVSVGMGIWAGVYSYQHFEHSLWYAVGDFIALAFITGLVIFPVAYVVCRALLQLVRVTSWALPVIGSIHGFFFGFVSAFWDGVVKAYRKIEAAWKPSWNKAAKKWDESWEAARQMIEERFSKKK